MIKEFIISSVLHQQEVLFLGKKALLSQQYGF